MKEMVRFETDNGETIFVREDCVEAVRQYTDDLELYGNGLCHLSLTSGHQFFVKDSADGVLTKLGYNDGGGS